MQPQKVKGWLQGDSKQAQQAAGYPAFIDEACMLAVLLFFKNVPQLQAQTLCCP